MRWVQLWINHTLDKLVTDEEDVYPVTRDDIFSLDTGNTYWVSKDFSISVPILGPTCVVASKWVIMSTGNFLAKAHEVVQLVLNSKILGSKQMSLFTPRWWCPGEDMWYTLYGVFFLGMHIQERMDRRFCYGDWEKSKQGGQSWSSGILAFPCEV